MSKLEVDAIEPQSGTTLTIGASGDTVTIPSGASITLTDGVSGDFKMNSGYGSVATAYGCRAWVSFDGDGTVAINDSGNVTSITDGGVGIYTVNFTTNMPDANYSCMATPGFATSTGLNFNASVHAPTISSFVLRTRNVNTGNQGDLSLITSAVFR